MRWIEALKEWNKGQTTWCIPRKGSRQYEEVRALMGPAVPKALKAPKARKPRAAAPKAARIVEEVRAAEAVPPAPVAYEEDIIELPGPSVAALAAKNAERQDKALQQLRQFAAERQAASAANLAPFRARQAAAAAEAAKEAEFARKQAAHDAERAAEYRRINALDQLREFEYQTMMRSPARKKAYEEKMDRIRAERKAIDDEKERRRVAEREAESAAARKKYGPFLVGRKTIFIGTIGKNGFLDSLNVGYEAFQQKAYGKVFKTLDKSPTGLMRRRLINGFTVKHLHLTKNTLTGEVGKPALDWDKAEPPDGITNISVEGVPGTTWSVVKLDNGSSSIVKRGENPQPHYPLAKQTAEEAKDSEEFFARAFMEYLLSLTPQAQRTYVGITKKAAGVE